MKTRHAIFACIILAAATIRIKAQNHQEEYLGLPGDNLNLYAVMNLFQNSETLEQFEKDLNSDDQMINNLDLNGDNLIDYITVSDYVQGDVHNIVLRAVLNQNEQQDVAVFVVEKLRNGAVEIQLIGDEALYGPNYIVEPIYAETPNPGYTGSVYHRNANVVTTTHYEIAAWPLIRFMFHPRYVVWRSSWYWDYYPSYWRPWRAHYWHYYYGYHYHWHDHYYSHYRHWDHYRCRLYTTYYRTNVRVYSPTVVVNINDNRYRNTYARPDQRQAGSEYYARTASRRGDVTRAGVSRDNTTRVGVSRDNAARVGASRSSTGRREGTVTTRQGVQRNASTTTPTRTNVATGEQRTSRSAGVQRSQPSNRSSAVQRSQPSQSRSSAVQRSQPSQSRSSAVQRSQPSQSRSSAVQRSQPSQSRSSAVQRSQPSQSRSSAVQRSQPSKSRSSVQPSSSQRSEGSRRSSGSSRR